jgi:hypothetical protein
MGRMRHGSQPAWSTIQIRFVAFSDSRGDVAGAQS